MGFAFVDQLIDFVPGKKTVGIKKITSADAAYLTADKNIFPCLFAECIGQLNAWIVMQHNNFSQRPVAILYRELEFLGDANLGDTLHLETHLKSLDEKTSLFDGVVTVNDQVVFRVSDAAGAFLPMEQFINPAKVKQEFTELMQPTQIVSNNDHQNETLNLDYDRIIERTTDSLIATKLISADAHFFVDHFPNKPVLPISLLLQYQVNLIGKSTWLENNYLGKLTKITQVKISDFILPGNTLTTKIKIQEITDNYVMFNARTEIENKRICSANLTFSYPLPN